LIIERLDTGIDGSSIAMRSLDEDLRLPLAFNWEIITLKCCKEFIENIHYNAAIQVSYQDILIFGGVNKTTFKLNIDFDK
jgi:uncharacterized protein with PhoU and TrkA domain